MRSHSALYIDAGYLIASAATRLTGSSLRRGVAVDYAKLIDQLIELVEEDSGLPILRAYWYDAARNGMPDPDQEGIAILPRVKLRLGRIGVEGEQKGVDLRMGLDMVLHSRNSAIDSIYLLSGDDDLTEAVEEAQSQGVQVTVVAVPRKGGLSNGVSRHLLRAADAMEVISEDILDSAVAAIVAPKLDTVRVGVAAVAAATSVTPPPAAAPSPAPAPSPVVTPAAVAPIGTPPVRVATPTPKPADIARRTYVPATSSVAYSSGPGTTPFIAPEHAHDFEELNETIDEVVRRAYVAWKATATQAQLDELPAGRPSIPRELDRALLFDLSDALDDDNLSDPVRFRLRARFWDHAG